MAQALEALTNYVKNTIDDLEDEELEEILSACKKLKIKRPTDFDTKFINKDDIINENISPLFVNKLFINSPALVSTPPTSTNNVPAIIPPSVQSRLLEYKINYDDLGFSNFLEQKKRNPRKEIDFCNKIVEKVIEEFGYSHPKRPLWIRCAEQLSNDHPEIFKIVLNGVPTNNNSFLMRRLENRFHHLREKDHANPTANTSHHGRKRKVDMVGTKHEEYFPQHPTDRTAEELEMMRLKLQQDKENNTWELPIVRAEMKILYSKLREFINKFDATQTDTDSPIPGLQTQWPFCFVYDVIRDHFDRLTGINSEEKFDDFRFSTLDILLQYLCTHKKKDNKTVAHIYAAMKKKAEPEEPGVNVKFYIALRMLTFYMNEDISAVLRLIKPRDEGLYDDELTSEMNLPSTPVIVAIGPSVCHPTTEYRIVIDKKYVVARLSSFVQSLLYTFAVHYVFRIHYSSQLKATLEYIQTAVLHMVPAVGEGSKSAKKGGGATPERRCIVTRLINEVTDFKNDLEYALHEL